jgi:hypothetical protein
MAPESLSTFQEKLLQVPQVLEVVFDRGSVDVKLTARYLNNDGWGDFDDATYKTWRQLEALAASYSFEYHNAYHYPDGVEIWTFVPQIVE